MRVGDVGRARPRRACGELRGTNEGSTATFAGTVSIGYSPRRGFGVDATVQLGVENRRMVGNGRRDVITGNTNIKVAGRDRVGDEKQNGCLIVGLVKRPAI